MNGSVRKRGSTWSYRYNLVKANGKRMQKEKGGFATKKEAQQALIATLNEYNITGRIIEDKKISLHDVYENFIINEAPITRKPSTITRYKSLYNNHICDAFGFRIIGSITPNEIQKFISNKTKTHSNEYIRSIYNFLYVLFDYSIRMEYITTNALKKVSPPKKNTSNDIRIFTTDELNLMYKRLSTTNLQPAFNIANNTGVRAGENYALRWSDVDLNNNTVKIDKQLQYYNKRWCFTTLKTKNSYRIIVFSNKFKQYLIDLKDKQNKLKLFYKDSYVVNKVYDMRHEDSHRHKLIEIDDFINVKPNGIMLNTYSHKVISRIMKDEYNIDFKYHNLRHTHATLLLEKGINPKYIQQRLGHSKLEFTLKLYTHVTTNMDNQVINVLDNYLSF